MELEGSAKESGDGPYRAYTQKGTGNKPVLHMLHAKLPVAPLQVVHPAYTLSQGMQVLLPGRANAPGEQGTAGAAAPGHCWSAGHVTGGADPPAQVDPGPQVTPALVELPSGQYSPAATVQSTAGETPPAQ